MKTRWIAFCLALMMCFGIAGVNAQAASAQDYKSHTVKSYDGITYTFEAARKITYTFTLYDTVSRYPKENVDVYMVKPGSKVTVQGTDGKPADGKITKYTDYDIEGMYVYWASETVTSGAVEKWFETPTLEKSSIAEIITQRTAETVTIEGMSFEQVKSQTEVYVALDNGTLLPAKGSSSPSFTDVASDAYYADAVAWAVENEVTTGTTATTFSPNDTCTTAHFLTFLWRALDCPVPTAESPFTDVAEDVYYSQSSVWAYEKGLVSGTAFNGNTPCTRAMMVEYLWKLAGSPEAEAAADFSDVAADALYAQAVAWGVAQGITNGTSDTEFSPDATCTRGQIVTILYRHLVGEN